MWTELQSYETHIGSVGLDCCHSIIPKVIDTNELPLTYVVCSETFWSKHPPDPDSLLCSYCQGCLVCVDINQIPLSGFEKLTMYDCYISVTYGADLISFRNRYGGPQIAI